MQITVLVSVRTSGVLASRVTYSIAQLELHS